MFTTLKTLFKGAVCVALILGLVSNAFAQNFLFQSDQRFLVAQLPGHTGGNQTPASFADFTGYLSSSNSINDYYTAIQNSTVTLTQLICNTYITLQGTVPPNGPNANIGSYCAISFNVSSPVTANFTFSNFYVSNNGISYDGPAPSVGILGADNCSFDNQTSGSVQLNLQPDNTYTFFEQMTGFSYADQFDDQTVSVNVSWQENMSLTIIPTSPVPEPSFALLLVVGLITASLVKLRSSRIRSKQA